jgi:hypothetical protein
MREALAANIDTNQSINEFIANKLDMKVSDVRPILSRIRSKLSKKSFTHERPTLQEYDVLKKGLLQALMERFQASQLAKQFDRQVVLQQCKDVIAIVDHTAVRGSYVAAERAAVTAVAELCRRFNCRDQYLEMLDKVLVYITKKYPDTDNA